MVMSFGFLLLIVVPLIGLGMLGAGIFVLLQDSQGTRRTGGIILLILGLLLMCALTVVGFAFFFLPMHMG
ncbi:MAG: hypothetical protein ACP5J4_13445 [Anaerolineae bacterium]